MGYSNDISHRDFQLLRRLSREIDEFFKVSHLFENVRASDIYDFIKNRPLLKDEFPTGTDFSRFLRRMHSTGMLIKVISNHEVDTTNYHHFRWWFFRKELKTPQGVNSESVKSNFNYFRSQRTVITNNGDITRSKQEQYIYDRLLSEENLRIYYESSIKIKKEKKYPDFTVCNKLTKRVYRWEHLGMAQNSEYALKTCDTVQWYIDKGYQFIENGGTVIVTYYRNEHEFRNEVERIIDLIKSQ